MWCAKCQSLPQDSCGSCERVVHSVISVVTSPIAVTSTVCVIVCVVFHLVYCHRGAYTALLYTAYCTRNVRYCVRVNACVSCAAPPPCTRCQYCAAVHEMPVLLYTVLHRKLPTLRPFVCCLYSSSSLADHVRANACLKPFTCLLHGVWTYGAMRTHPRPSLHGRCEYP